MQKELFQSYLRQGFNRIPLVREVLADFDTPLSVYVKLANRPYSYLLESMQGGEKWGRYSIIGLSCKEVIKVNGHQIRIEKSGKAVRSVATSTPLQWLEDFCAEFRAPEIEGLPRFNGGVVGYFGYDTVRYIEPRLENCPNPDPLQTPDILLMVSDEVVVFDNLKSTLQLIVHAGSDEEYNTALQRLDELEAQLAQPVSIPALHQQTENISEDDFISGFTEESYKQAVEKARQYIIDGDIMQVVLSQRLSIPFSAAPLDLYRSLRILNPSPYMYFMNLGDFYVVGSSPEILTHIEDDVVTVRPLAGTRPRGKTEAEDQQNEIDLLQDPKELAEHLMLIDLGRNDIGRVSETGSVQLTDKMIVERYSHVMHIVSNVTGKLKKDLNAFDVLRATFPAGTLSGASKVRAMEIIDELEPVKRSIYGGAVGYIGWSGNMDMAIAIRTAVIKDQQLHVQAGAGIVYDSVPQTEWDETMNKGRAIFRAVALATQGLHVPAAREDKRGS